MGLGKWTSKNEVELTQRSQKWRSRRAQTGAGGFAGRRKWSLMGSSKWRRVLGGNKRGLRFGAPHLYRRIFQLRHKLFHIATE